MNNSELLEVTTRLKIEAVIGIIVWLTINASGFKSYRTFKRIIPLIGTIILALPILLVSIYIWLHPLLIIHDELTGFPGNYLEFKHNVVLFFYLFICLLIYLVVGVINTDPKAPYPKKSLLGLMQNDKEIL